jgi:hypothetical protein
LEGCAAPPRLRPAPLPPNAVAAAASRVRVPDVSIL